MESVTMHVPIKTTQASEPINNDNSYPDMEGAIAYSKALIDYLERQRIIAGRPRSVSLIVNLTRYALRM